VRRTQPGRGPLPHIGRCKELFCSLHQYESPAEKAGGRLGSS